MTKQKKTLRRFIVPAGFVLVLAAVTVLRNRPEPAGPPELYSFTGPTMGTSFTVRVVAPELTGDASHRISEAIAAVLEEVDASMSTWRQDSEISRFNRWESEPFEASSGLLEVVAAAQDIAEASDGAFDITVLPLVEAWGFGAEGRQQPPSDGELAALAKHTGWRRLHVDSDAGTLSKEMNELRIDLSAIAKGYCVDRVTEAVGTLGYQNLMVEIGGEVRTTGRALEGRPWRIGIEAPDHLGRQAHGVLELSEQAMATSGDYRNFREIDGTRVSHTIDPRSARPVSHDLASVTVVAAACMQADAWATALNVLGPEVGMALAERHGLAASFLVRKGDEFDEITSSAFAALRAARVEEPQS